MNHSLMTNAQRRTEPQSPWWALARGETLRLEVGPGSRCLQVLEGRVWITVDSTKHAASIDIWLTAGDELVMAPFSRWVAEADSAARFQLLVPPRAADRVPLLARLKARFGWIGQSVAGHRSAWS